MQRFASLHSKLDKQCRYYSRHLGHVRALIANDDLPRVMDDSILGRVLVLGNSEVINALILFNTRIMDNGSDTITLRKLVGVLPSGPEIEQHHKARMSDFEGEACLKRYHAATEEFRNRWHLLNKNETETKLRKLRTYVLAHNIEPEVVPERATLCDLVEFTQRVHELVDLAGFIANSTSPFLSELSDSAEKQTKAFYAVLPPLVSIEPY